MSGGSYAAFVVELARSQLDASIEREWVIRPDTFDCIRDELEADRLLVARPDAEPLLLGLPYRFEWLPTRRPIELRLRAADPESRRYVARAT